MSFQTNCSRLPDVSFFLISSFKRSFFLLSYVPRVKVNLKSWTGFTDHKQVGDWSDFNFSLVQLLVFLYRAPGRHWSVEAYHAPRGNTGAWSLEETLFRVCEFKKLHNCCAITRICAGGLTACFPPWALCVCFCLFYWVIQLCFQQCSDWPVWSFVVPFLQIGHTGCLKIPCYIKACSLLLAVARFSCTAKQLLHHLCSVATFPLTFVL